MLKVLKKSNSNEFGNLNKTVMQLKIKKLFLQNHPCYNIICILSFSFKINHPITLH